MPRDFLKVKWVVRWFAMVMQRKLQDNNHKPPWWEQENSYLLMRLQQETGELTEAFGDGDSGRIIEEAADVANFAMMLADNAQRQLEGGA